MPNAFHFDPEIENRPNKSGFVVLRMSSGTKLLWIPTVYVMQKELKYSIHIKFQFIKSIVTFLAGGLR